MTKQPYCVIPGEKKRPIVLLCEHASPRIPGEYQNLGISPEELNGHYGWDIGALDVYQCLASKLEIEGIHSTVSRLLIDFNRRAECQDLIRRELDPGKTIPGNKDLSEEEVNRRLSSYWKPFHKAVEESICSHMEEKLNPFLISVHSFTPVLNGEKRDLDMGLLFYPPFSTSYSRSVSIKEALEKKGYTVELNKPYSVENPHPYPIHHYAEKYNLSYLAVEINNSLIKTPGQARKVGTLIAEVLKNF